MKKKSHAAPEKALIKKIFIVLLLGFISLLLADLAETGIYLPASVSCGEVIRLHIPANSDSVEDQAVKLAVRDAVLREFSSLSRSATSRESAELLYEENLDRIEAVAERVLSENGFSYGAHAEIAESEFPERSYGALTLGHGSYTALRIKLGSGEGKNWWCVMYPPLCFINIRSDGEADKAEDDKLELRWFTRELFEQTK